MTEILLTTLKFAIAAMILAVGMGSTPKDAAWVLWRPALLLKSVLAMYVIVPLIVLLTVVATPLVPGVKAALLVFAASSGAPLLPKRLGATSGDGYAFSLVVLSSLLAILIVPVWIAALASYFGVEAELSPIAVAKSLLIAFLLPIAVGMLLRALWPTLETFSNYVLAAGGILTAASALLLLVLHYEILTQAASLGLVVLLGLLVAALITGHVLGGPEPAHRTTLGVACVTRHIGIALLVATSFRGPRTIVMVAAYTVASILITFPYIWWRRAKAVH